MLNIFPKAIFKAVSTGFEVDLFTIIKALPNSQPAHLEKTGHISQNHQVP